MYRHRARRWIALLRCVAVLLLMHVTGVLHAAADVVLITVDAGVDHAEGCPSDRPCEDCPAGCPSCHCTSSLRSALPASPPGTPVVGPSAVLVLPTVEATAAPRPDLPPLYRPPRA